MSIVCINGGFEEEHLPPREAGLHYHFSVGVYETLRTVRGRLFNWAAHAERLKQSAEGMGFAILPGDLEMFRGFAQQVVDQNMAEDSWPDDLEARVRIQVNPQGYYYIQALPVLEMAQTVSREGVSAVTRCRERPNPHVKAIDPVFTQWSQREKSTTQASEIFLMNDNGEVTEGSMSNVFIVNQAGVLVTPGENILEGTTRQRILDLAKEWGMKVELRPLRARDVYGAREVFFSNVTLESIPVVKVDEKVIGTGSPGFTAIRMGRALKKQRLNFDDFEHARFS